MRIISYIAMIATAALCQLSSCMNQAGTTVNGNQPQPAVRTIDALNVIIPKDFISTFRKTDNIVIDFDAGIVLLPCRSNIVVSCNRCAEMGKTSVSIEYKRLPCSEDLVQTGSCVVAIDLKANNAPSGENIQFSEISVETWRPVEVNWNTKSLLLPSRKDIQFSVVGSECNASLSIVHNWSPTSPSPAGAPRACQAPLVETRPTIERKKKNAQRKMSREREIDSEDLKEKTKESKPLKQPDSLKEIDDLNSHIKKSPKKEAKKIEQFERKTFLDKYSTQPLDDKVREQIKLLYDSGIKSPTRILDTLLTPSNNQIRETEFASVRGKVNYFIKILKSERKAAD